MRSEPIEAVIVRTILIIMIMSIVLTITASIGSDRNVLESLPSINTEETSEEPTIPENN
mgnify:CR=1 FL=1